MLERLCKRNFIAQIGQLVISHVSQSDRELIACANTATFLKESVRLATCDRSHYAQEILLKNLANPPSLLELARQVGMCDYNLRQGFKEIFNTTVFGDLRDRRMERAQQLLLDGQLKVATVARAVGYDSPTLFNAAFKQKYGTSPKAYQPSIRK